MQISELLKYLRVNPRLSVDTATYYHIIMPFLTSEPHLIEQAFHVVLPMELRDIWRTASTMAFCYDALYGQWGMILWSPEQVLVKHQFFKNIRPQEYADGDLIIGEFLGDNDLVVLRCDPNSGDFGSVLISLPIDPREDWYRCALSLNELIRGLIDNPGKKYWE